MTHEIRVPGDKSISHRALIFAALGSGRSRVRSILQSDDIQSTAGVLRKFGVAISPLAAEMTIDGVGLRGFHSPHGDLDCGNSGTTARLISGVAAALPFRSRFVGDASLSRRPMRRLARPLEEMGATFEFEDSDGLPMMISGAKLRDLAFVNERGSAQIKSALLLAGLVSPAAVEVSEPRQSRNHTEVMLAALGARIKHDTHHVTLSPVESISPLDFDVPADPSSAAFFAALAALTPGLKVRLKNVCLNPTRMGFFRALERMGASVASHESTALSIGEIAGHIDVQHGELSGISIAPEAVPSLVDELPLIACLAARSSGETRVEGAEELRVKESDRIAAIVRNLRSIGAEADELPDGFVVRGSEKPLAGRVVTYGDHRIAMAFAILGAATGNRIEVDAPSCVSISYPDFWSQLGKVRVA